MSSADDEWPDPSYWKSDPEQVRHLTTQVTAQRAASALSSTAHRRAYYNRQAPVGELIADPVPDATPTAADAALVDWARPLPPPRPTGLPPLDAIIGGLRAESVYGLNAPTGKGKTGLAIQLSRQIAKTTPVVYLSSELSRRQVIARVAAQLLGTSWLEIYNKPPEACEVLRDVLDRMAPMLHVVKLTRGMNIGNLLRAEADRLGTAPLAVLDYLQHAARRVEVKDFRIAISALSDEISSYAVDTGGSALVISSVARGYYAGNENKSAVDFLGTAKDSGDIEFDAAAIMFLDCDPCPLGGTSNARLHVAKSRFGHTGTVGLQFDGAKGIFLPDPTGALTDDQRDAYDLIRNGASSVEEVRSRMKIGKPKAEELIGALVGRGMVLKRPLRVA